MVSTIAFCGFILANMTGGHRAEDFMTVPAIGIMTGILGLFTALPTAIILGAPIVWLYGKRLAASPMLFAVLLAAIGGVAGRAMFLAFFNSGLDAFIEPAIYACPIFGAVVAGLHPIVTAWLCRSDETAFTASNSA